MAKTLASFTAAFKAHGEGRLAEAESGYRTVLKVQPKNADAWHLLGVAVQQQGRPAEAIEHIQKALKIVGPNGAYLANLGVALQAAGRSGDAVPILEQAAALTPSAQAHFALGNALQSLERHEEAIARYERALALDRTNASAHNNLGSAHKALGRLNEAAAAYQRTITYQPGHSRAHYNLGVVQKDAGRLEEAAASFRKAIALAPQLAEAHVNLGVMLHELGNIDEAHQHVRRATELNPMDAAAFNNLGAVLRDMGRFDEAMQSYATALSLKPTMAAAVHNEGIALQVTGREDEAIDRYQRAHVIQPEFAAAEMNAALLRLMTGDFEGGWKAYECRWRSDARSLGLRTFPYPQWQGEDGGKILVWGEQGIGDRVIYASMIPDLIARGHDVVMEAEPRLVALFARSFPRITIVAKQDPPHLETQRPDIRWQSPLANLGRWLRPNLESFPQHGAYLTADENRRVRYRSQLEADHTGPIVGISWISRNPKAGQHKSSGLKDWAPLLQMKGVRFVDLQYGDTAEERTAVESALSMRIMHMPDLDSREDIDGVTALAAACDLVISVSNTTVHLAAALGKPTWVMVPAATGNLWYWMRGNTPTPWYPSVRIFRQAKLGQWAETVQRIAHTLEEQLQQIN